LFGGTAGALAQVAAVFARPVRRAGPKVAVNDELRDGTLRLTLLALGVVLGLSAAASLPLLLPWSQSFTVALLVAVVALSPWLLALPLRRLRVALSSPRALPISLAVALGSALVSLPLVHIYRGTVRVLNHGDEPFYLYVDGERVARVEPSSGESALAGVELAVPAGERELRAVSTSYPHRDWFRARELVQGGSPHLFAPLSSGYCFSIERRSYGMADQPTLEVVPLEGENPFWVLPEGISWFTPNPEPGPLRTSGGTLACLRQKRCQN
jgi:hypothetical protein